MFLYTMLATFGSIFLVTWGHSNWFKIVMNFAFTFPIGWDKLIVKSFFFLPLNILFWTILAYFFSLLIIKIVRSF